MQGYRLPKVTVSSLKPMGFSVSIPDEKGISLFAFHGKLNRPIKDHRDLDWACDVTQKHNGKWTYTNQEVNLKRGDVIYYWITVRYKGLDYHLRNLKYEKGYFS